MNVSPVSATTITTCSEPCSSGLLASAGASSFEDTINGLNNLAERPNAISFLRTIIAIHDIGW